MKVFSKYPFIALFLLIVISFLVFCPSLENDFIPGNDDNGHLLQNELARSLSWKNIPAIFTQTISDTYLPLTVLSFAVEYHFFQYHPFVYHLDNLLLHLAVTGLLFWFGLRIGLSTVVSFLAALLFSIHPMRVESVVWVTERKDVLYAFFYVLALHSYWEFLENQKKRFYVLSLMCGILSLLSKITAVTLPLTLLLLDWLKGRGDIKHCFIQKIPFGMYAIPLAWISYHVNTAVMAVDSSLLQALLIFSWTFAFYVKNFFFPGVWSIVYMLPEPVSLHNPAYLFSVFLFAAFMFCLFQCRREKLLTFALMFYIINIFIMWRFDRLTGFNVVADRFSYLASFGLSLGFIFTWDLFTRGKKTIRSISYVGLAVFYSLLLFKTLEQSKVWKDELTFWNYTVNVSPKLSLAYNNRGNIFQSHGRLDKALLDYNQAIKLNPTNVQAYNNRGTLYMGSDEYDLAVHDFYQAVILNPVPFEEAYYNLGVLYLKQDKLDRAIYFFNEVIQINPNNVSAYINLGTIFGRRNDYKMAINIYTKGIKVSPNEKIVYINRGASYLLTGRPEEALADFNQALYLDPQDATAYYYRSSCHKRLNNIPRALDDALQAKTLGHANADASVNELRAMIERK